MSGDRGHPGPVRLLPFAAAAVDSLMFWLQTRGRRVYAGRSGWSAGFSKPMEVGLGRCGCCTFMLHLSPDLPTWHLSVNAAKDAAL